MSETIKKWETQCSKFLKGKKIKEVRYMNDDEAKKFMWYSKPLIIIFDDGGYLIPSADDEGNDGGALFTSDDKLPIIPVMR